MNKLDQATYEKLLHNKLLTKKKKKKTYVLNPLNPYN